MRWWLIMLTLPLLAGCSAAGSGMPDASEPVAGTAAPARPADTAGPATATTAPAAATEPPGATAAPAATTTPVRAALPDYGPAPEFTNSTWLNTDRPLRLADLRGRVVALDMWTFG